MKTKINFRSILIGVSLLFVAVSYIGAISIYSDTIVSIFPVVAIALLIALSTFWPARGKWPHLSGCDVMWINAAIHTIAATGILLFIFFVGNYAGADRSTDHVEYARIERKFTKTRYHSRRVNRRVTTRGTPYKVYFADLRLSDGRVKQLEMSQTQYNRLRWGNRVEMTVARGFFGVNVIRRDVPLKDAGL